jgi:hypothetical protein
VAIEGLGYRFNFVPIAAATLISIKDAPGVTFFVTGNDTFTLSSAATYNGSTTALAVITDYYTCTSTSGAAKWVAATQAAASTLTIASGSAAFFVDAAGMPSAAEYLEVTVAASGLVYAVLDYPLIQRAPANLRQLSGSAS